MGYEVDECNTEVNSLVLTFDPGLKIAIIVLQPVTLTTGFEKVRQAFNINTADKVK